MKINSATHSLRWAVGLLCAVTACSSWAQYDDEPESTPISVRIGVAHIKPQVDSSDLSAPSLPGSRVNVGAATALSGGVTLWTDENWALDIPVALPFQHSISGAGALQGTGELGTVKTLPFTVLAQYHMGSKEDTIRPYVGAGLTYAYFFGERSNSRLSAITGVPNTTMNVASRLAFSMQAGANVKINPRYSLDVMLGKTFLKTKSTMSSGQSMDIRLDPWVMGLGVTYHY